MFDDQDMSQYLRAVARENLAGEIALGLAVLKTSTAELARWRKRFAERAKGTAVPKPLAAPDPIAPTIFTWHARDAGPWKPLYLN